MTTRRKVLCLFVLGFTGGRVNAQTENFLKPEWSRENDRMYSKNIQSSVVGGMHLRLWLSPKNILHFTVMSPCLMNKRDVQVVTWEEGSTLATVGGCDGRITQTDLPRYIEEQFYPLPRIIEVVRKKPSKKNAVVM